MIEPPYQYNYETRPVRAPGRNVQRSEKKLRLDNYDMAQRPSDLV
jgi:hypothetical protein